VQVPLNYQFQQACIIFLHQRSGYINISNKRKFMNKEKLSQLYSLALVAFIIWFAVSKIRSCNKNSTPKNPIQETTQPIQSSEPIRKEQAVEAPKPKEKPKLCDCQNEYYHKMAYEALGTVSTPHSQEFLDDCFLIYSLEKVTFANCGLTDYDPNFKAQ